MKIKVHYTYFLKDSEIHNFVNFIIYLKKDFKSAKKKKVYNITERGVMEVLSSSSPQEGEMTCIICSLLMWG